MVYLRPELARRARFARKQAGQLPSKLRFIAAQFEALLTDDLWLEQRAPRQPHGRRARRRDQRAARRRAAARPQANSLFVQLPAAAIAPLQAWSFFWDWDLAERLVRWMTSFATTDEDVRRFADGVRHYGELAHAPVPEPVDP